MPAGHSSYKVDDYTAFSIEKVIRRDWKFQITKANPLIACISERRLKFHRGHRISDLAALVPLIYTDIAAFNENTAGVSDANEVPTGWPDYDPTEGFTHARYEFTHLRRPVTFKDSEKKLTANSQRGNLVDGKIKQLMSKFRTIIATMASGSNASSRLKLLGLQHAIATSNTVGGIDQSDSSNDWWRGIVNNVGAALSSLTEINDLFDEIATEADDSGDTEEADLLLLSFSGGSSVNVYNQVREQIDPQERFTHKAFKVKYGIKNFDYMGMKCVRDNRGGSGQAVMLTTSTWHYGGMKNPRELAPARILGSDADERFFNLWCFLACDEIRRNGRLTGITA